MADRPLRWRPPPICATWAHEYYREFFPQFPKIRFAVDVSSVCDGFSLELAKLSDRFLAIGSSEELLEEARQQSKDYGSQLAMDFQKETLEEMLDRLDGNIRNCPDFLTASNAFVNQKQLEEGVHLVS